MKCFICGQRIINGRDQIVIEDNHEFLAGSILYSHRRNNDDSYCMQAVYLSIAKDMFPVMFDK